jgi:hypothetical protein
MGKPGQAMSIKRPKARRLEHPLRVSYRRHERPPALGGGQRLAVLQFKIAHLSSFNSRLQYGWNLPPPEMTKGTQTPRSCDEPPEAIVHAVHNNRLNQTPPRSMPADPAKPSLPRWNPLEISTEHPHAFAPPISKSQQNNATNLRFAPPQHRNIFFAHPRWDPNLWPVFVFQARENWGPISWRRN